MSVKLIDLSAADGLELVTAATQLTPALEASQAHDYEWHRGTTAMLTIQIMFDILFPLLHFFDVVNLR